MPMQARVTPGAAMINKANYERDIQSVTKVRTILTNTLLFNYIVLSYGLPASTLTSTLENVLTDDPTNPNGYIQKSKSDLVSVYSQIAKDFNFDADGNLKSGMPPRPAQIEEHQQWLYGALQRQGRCGRRHPVAAYKEKHRHHHQWSTSFLADANLTKLALTAVAWTRKCLTTRQLKQILTLRSQRSQELRQCGQGRALREAGQGHTTSRPMLAGLADPGAVGNGNPARFKELRAAQVAIRHRRRQDQGRGRRDLYSDNIAKIEKLDDLLKDKKLTGFVLQAYGLDPEKYDAEELRKIFSSDLSDKNTTSTRCRRTKFRDIVASFNFNAKGQVERQTEAQSRRATV